MANDADIVVIKAIEVSVLDVQPFNAAIFGKGIEDVIGGGILVEIDVAERMESGIKGALEIGNRGKGGAGEIDVLSKADDLFLAIGGGGVALIREFIPALRR